MKPYLIVQLLASMAKDYEDQDRLEGSEALQSAINVLRRVSMENEDPLHKESLERVQSSNIHYNGKIEAFVKGRFGLSLEGLAYMHLDPIEEYVAELRKSEV